jgi:hypothetical protein
MTEIGTVASAVRQELHIYDFDVRLFGAKGDGDSDDTAAIQNAINEAKGGGGRVLLSSGIYVISEPLDLTDALGVSLLGAARGSSQTNTGSTLKLADGANCSMIEVFRDSLVGYCNVEIENLVLWGSRAAQNYTTCKAADTGHGVHIKDMDGVKIRNVFMRGMVGHNISVTDGISNGLVISDCFLFDPARNNINGAAMADSLIHGSQIGFAGTFGWDEDTDLGHCVLLASDNNIVSSCRIWQAVGHNVFIQGGTGNVVSTNIIDGPTRSNVRLLDAHENLIIGNRMFDAGVYRNGRDTSSSSELQSGISISSSSTGNLVKDNTCVADVKSHGAEEYVGFQRYGIYCEGSRNLIESNWCLGSFADGIRIDGDHNDVYRNTSVANVEAGIRIEGDQNGVKNNRCYLNANGVVDNGSQNAIGDNDEREPWGSYSSTLAADAGHDDTTISVASASGLAVGDTFVIETDDGIWLVNSVAGISGTTITLERPLKGETVIATSGNTVTKSRQSFSSSGRSLAISSGIIVASRPYHVVDTEASAASDDLSTISTDLSPGSILVLRAISSDRTVTVKDGTGNLRLSADMVLDHATDTITLMWDGSIWAEIARSDNAS